MTLVSLPTAVPKMPLANGAKLMNNENPSPDTDVKGQQARERTTRSSDGRQEGVRTVSMGELNASIQPGGKRLSRSLLDPIHLTLSVELGRVEITFRDLQSVAQGAIIELDHMVGDPLDIRANGYLIARGEVVAVKDERYGIRITEVVRQPPAEEDDNNA